MQLFIPCIPDSVSEADLRRFMQQALCSPWRRLLKRWGHIGSIRILKITHQESRSVEYHGLVDVEPARQAERLIKKLNNTLLGGEAVEVRQYHRRSGFRERRRQHSGMESLAITDRRTRERRRGSLIIEQVPVSGEAPSPGTGSAFEPVI